MTPHTPHRFETYDVLVIGGGSAGLCAAIQAGRLGRRVLLVEKAAQLGGTTTTGGVNAVQTFFAYGQQVIAGIGWEMCRRTYEVLGLPVPDGSKYKPTSGIVVTWVDRGVYAAVADMAVLEAGVDLRLHTMVGAVAREDDDDLWRVTLCGKEGLVDVRGRVLVDCSGDANAVSLAGLEVEHADTVRQPGTLVMGLTGYDAQTLDYDAIQRAFDEAVTRGELKRSDAGFRGGRIEPMLRDYGGNAVHVVSESAQDSPGRTAMEIEGRRVMLRLTRFFRQQPGLEKLTVAWFSPEVGVRETVRIRGKARITARDYESGRVWPDAVCHSFYSIDEHKNEGPTNYRPLKRGVVPTIPYGALLPVEGRNVIVAGRCISGDREAFSAYRVQASCMAMGQAAGAAAALAVSLGVPCADVPIDQLRPLLAEHGAIVPGAAVTVG
ncbi:MAG: FAD-dependent oxidoreductase [Phycisphaera sp.]|nr:FAD-dependent oxidoreductase [Phycisphaera sp.]